MNTWDAVVTAHKRDVLRGTLDADNPLSKLRGNSLVWSHVFKGIERLVQHIDSGSVAHHVVTPPLGRLRFPPPADVNVNMMPIKLWQLEETLPENLQQYIPMIRACPVTRDTNSKVVYLTVHESLVPAGESQRRPGLHVERPGQRVDGHIYKKCNPSDSVFRELSWGLGNFSFDEHIPIDGIFMASSVAGSCRVWPVLIDNPEEVTDAHGGMEIFRPYIGEGLLVPADQIWWITDRTPHESLPLQVHGAKPRATHVYRQFFRLVVGRISVWYARHNTPNPLGVQPDAPISDEDRFTHGQGQGDGPPLKPLPNDQQQPCVKAS